MQCVGTLSLGHVVENDKEPVFPPPPWHCAWGGRAMVLREYIMTASETAALGAMLADMGCKLMGTAVLQRVRDSVEYSGYLVDFACAPPTVLAKPVGFEDGTTWCCTSPTRCLALREIMKTLHKLKMYVFVNDKHHALEVTPS